MRARLLRRGLPALGSVYCLAGSHLSRGVDFADLNGDGSQDLVIANRALLGLRYLNNDQCASGSCAPGHVGPFDNFGPTIAVAKSSAVVPPGGAPINIDQRAPKQSQRQRHGQRLPDGLHGLCRGRWHRILVHEWRHRGGICATSRITPGAGAADGVISVSLKVFDSEDYSGAFHCLDLTVGTGSAPAFTTSATLPPATEDAAYTTTITASDNDGNVPLVFEAVGAPADLARARRGVQGPQRPCALSDAADAAVQGNVGNDSIAIRVTDSGGLSTTQTFTLAVTNVNDKPSVTTTTLPNGTQGQAYSATVTASDEDGTTPTFATPNTSLPTGLALSAAGAH